MRIAMIQDDWWPRTGGGPVHVKELSVALAKHHDCTVDIYTRALEHDGEKHVGNATFESGRVTVRRLSPCTGYWNPVGRVTSMATPIPHILSGDYDIIHGHTFLPAVPTRIAGMLTNIPTVFTVHGTALNSGVGRDESWLAGIKRRIEKQFLLGFDYDTVISVNDEHVNLLKTHHEDVQTIANGVDMESFSPDMERTRDILFLGRLAPKKRVSDLISAFADIESEFPDSTLRIVGTGPKREPLEDHAASLGITDRVSFEGRVSDEAVPQYYGTAAVFVLPSIWEGHPLTLLEAWASGTPVIASAVEGIEEFVEHEQTGYLVPPESPADLADMIRSVLENPQAAEQVGENARKLVGEDYSWEGVANRTYEQYQKIV